MIKEKFKCYISTKNNDIHLVDMKENSISKSIKLPFNPFSLTSTSDIKKIYVGSNKNGIALIETENNKIKFKDIDNNGNIAIDEINKKVYIANISQIEIYDMECEKKLGEINGFKIIDSFKLSKNCDKLFVLDLFNKELKIYNTYNLNIIKKIKNIGIKPSAIVIDEENDKCFIGNRGGIDEKSGNITFIDLNNDIKEFIEFESNSSISSLILKDDFLYACNIGLKRIEVIDLNLKKVIKYISKKNFNPINIYSSLKNKSIIVVNELYDKTIELCEIDINRNNIINTLEINKNIKELLDVVFIFNEESYEKEKHKEETIDIELRKILIKYSQTIDFDNLIIDVPIDYVEKFALEDIKFSKGFIVKGTEEISLIENEEHLYRINFLLRVPYIIKMKNEKNRNIIIKKTIEKYMGILVDIPMYDEKKSLDLNVNTRINIKDTPVMIKEILNFSVEVIMELKVFDIVEVSIPLNIIKKYEKK